MRRLEIAAALVLTAAALFLHITFFRNAGPLWRDEIVSLHTSRVPFGSFLERLQFDSFPAFWLLLLRGWSGLSGFHLLAFRLFGVLIGLLCLAAMFFAARVLGVRVPLIAISLAGCAGTVVRYGDSLRAYGFSACIGLLSMALLYRTVEMPSRRSFLLALLASLASVHTTYYNCVLLFACCVAAAASDLYLRRVRNAIAVTAIGLLCALSMLVYIPVFREVSRWSDLTRYDIDFLWISVKFAEAAGPALPVWIGSLVIAIALASGSFTTNPELRVAGEGRVAMIFAVTALVVFLVSDLLFLRLLRYLMQPWYFLLAFVVCAVLADAIIGLSLQRLPAVRAGAAVAILFFVFMPAYGVVRLRSTNMDRIAAVLARAASPRDLIVVYPWHLGTPFAEYYRGAAHWRTLPPLSDYSVQRYDEAKEMEMRPENEDALIGMVRQTLSNGGNVWYAGFPLFMESGAYLHKTAHPGGMVAADLRWSSKFQDAVAAAHTGMVMPGDGSTNAYERAELVRYAP